MTEENENQSKNEWMVRDCDIYKDEYKQCKSFKDRFHQYFTEGKQRDCSSWERDYNDCLKFKNMKDNDAFNRIIASERNRREERLKSHFQNNVWTKRDKPPENWHSPLPEWLEEKNANTYLHYKNKEDKEKKSVGK